MELFRNGSVYEFYRLKALIILKQVNTSVVEKKKKKIRWRGYVNFHCMQMRLVMILWSIFAVDQALITFRRKTILITGLSLSGHAQL